MAISIKNFLKKISLLFLQKVEKDDFLGKFLRLYLSKTFSEQAV